MRQWQRSQILTSLGQKHMSHSSTEFYFVPYLRYDIYYMNQGDIIALKVKYCEIYTRRSDFSAIDSFGSAKRCQPRYRDNSFKDKTFKDKKSEDKTSDWEKTCN